MKGKRVGVLKEGFDECEEDVVKIVKETANMLTKAGALVEEVSIPMHKDGNCKIVFDVLRNQYHYIVWITCTCT